MDSRNLFRHSLSIEQSAFPVSVSDLQVPLCEVPGNLRLVVMKKKPLRSFHGRANKFCLQKILVVPEVVLHQKEIVPDFF